MTLLDAIPARHSVRAYTDRPIPPEAAEQLRAELQAGNQAGGLHMQLVTDDPAAFDGLLAHYGKFRGVRHYIALIGPKTPDLEEKLGYYGERAALLAQTLGLNTCWVALTFRKGSVRSRCQIGPGEKLVCVLALGYGETQGVPHKSKDPEAVSAGEGPRPDWFTRGLEAALLAPTAMNQQKFRLTWRGTQVKAVSTGGFYSNVDLGIVKCHFELGAGTDSFTWA